MNTKYEKELNRICLHIHVTEIYEEDYQMPMLRANKIPGILEVNGCGIDGESRYTYEITGLVSMAVLFENKQVQKGDIEQFIYCLLESISQLQKYMLHPGCLLLEPEYVFCRKQKYFFCYLPGGKQELCESFHRMTEYFVEKLDYEDEQGITLAYELHKATLEENYDLDDLRILCRFIFLFRIQRKQRIRNFLFFPRFLCIRLILLFCFFAFCTVFLQRIRRSSGNPAVYGVLGKKRRIKSAEGDLEDGEAGMI